MGVNMRKISIGASDGIFKGFIEMNVSNRSVLDSMIKKLESIQGVQSVVRNEI